MSLTDERTVAPATDAPLAWRCPTKPSLAVQASAHVGSMPSANGLGVVHGSASFVTDEQAAVATTARHGTPLASPGDGIG